MQVTDGSDVECDGKGGQCAGKRPGIPNSHVLAEQAINYDRATPSEHGKVKLCLRQCASDANFWLLCTCNCSP